MRSGLFDRAENLFLELLDIGMYQPQALRHLIDIYQQEQDWSKALEYSSRLETVSGENRATERAHFYCEQAQEQLDRGAREEAADLLDKALLVDRRSVRASLLSADLAVAGRDFERALQHLKRVELQDIEFLPEVLPRLTKCYRALERPDDFRARLPQVSNPSDRFIRRRPIIRITPARIPRSPISSTMPCPGPVRSATSTLNC
jgi:lipopolysaccharide biosynthesis regulator YciM